VYVFLKNIGAKRRPFVKNIAVTLELVPELGLKNMGSNIPTAAMALLCQCGPLKKLTVHPMRPLGGSFLRVAGVKKLRELRSCKELHVDKNWAVGAQQGGFAAAAMDEFERVLREEICREPETLVEMQARIAAEEKQRMEDRNARMDVKWQTGLRPRL
jgi:hypothetical protein